MRNKKKALLFIAAILAFFFLGYLRDFIFVNLNDALYYIAHKQYKLQHGVDKRLQFLFNYSYKQLYYLKWLLTVMFSCFYFAVSFYTLRFLFSQKNIFKPLFILYTFLIVLSCMLTLIGILLNDNTWTYKTSRFLMGMAQSPIPLMILIFAIKLLQTENSQ